MFEEKHNTSTHCTEPMQPPPKKADQIPVGVVAPVTGLFFIIKLLKFLEISVFTLLHAMRGAAYVSSLLYYCMYNAFMIFIAAEQEGFVSLFSHSCDNLYMIYLLLTIQ